MVFDTLDGKTFSVQLDYVDLEATRRSNATQAEDPRPATPPTPASTVAPPAGRPQQRSGRRGPTEGSFRPLRLRNEDYNRLVCYATFPNSNGQPDTGRGSSSEPCDTVPPLATEDVPSLIGRLAGADERLIDRSAPVVVYVGLGDSEGRSIFVVAPKRSGVPFDPLGRELPRSNRFTAVSVTDFSEGLINSIEVSASERGRVITRDAFTDADPTGPPGLAADDDREVAVVVKSFGIPYTPGALSVEFVETDLATLQRRARTAQFAIPASHSINFDLGFIVPFNTVAVDRYSLREYTPESLLKIPGDEAGTRRIYYEQAKSYAYLTGIVNMTGLREKALEGEIGFLRPLAQSPAGRAALKVLWPDIVVGVGVPAVQSRFFKENSFYFGTGWRLGTNRVRLTWGYQFTTLDVLGKEYVVNEFVADHLAESDVIGRRSYHSLFWGISFSLVSFGRDSL